MLFDASESSVEENARQCREVVEEALKYGAHVEGEIAAFRRTEEVAGDQADREYCLETVVEFVKATGVDVFAPAIGNAHGVYQGTPKLDCDRVSGIAEQAHLPIALHGGTGMTPGQFVELIRGSRAKVNTSTALKSALKISHLKSGFDDMSPHPGKYDPVAVMEVEASAVSEMAKERMRLFGSVGRSCMSRR